MAQPLKKKEVKSNADKFNVSQFKKEKLGGNVAKVADKPIEWIVMPKAYQNALSLPGVPIARGVFSVRGWSDTGKSTLKNCAIAAAMKQGILPVIFETEGNFDFQYAKDCGMDITPVYDVDEETGEQKIVDWEGNFVLFTNRGICDYCGDMDYMQGKRLTKKRTTPVIEDVAFIIKSFLDMQDNGELPMPILFVWDSVGSISSFKSLTSKTGNNQFDAGAIATAFKDIFPRISASKEVGSPYSNTLFVVNKIWQDVMNSMGGAISIENSGGKTLFYATRLGIHCGGTAKAATKKLKATLKGKEYQYGTITKISVYKNQLPVPYNITYSGTMCCVHNGIISEDELDEYKKTQIPLIFEKMKNLFGEEEFKNAKAEDIVFTEEEELD